MKTFTIEQKITAFANQYFVYVTDGTSQPGTLVAFAHQKRLALKEKFTFYTNESKEQVLFEVQARKVIDLAARYEVRDEHGTVLGVIGKDFKASLLRSTWNMFTTADEKTPLLKVQERVVWVAILRRVWEFLPVANNIPFFIKYHFDFVDPASSEVVGVYNKTTTIRDHYALQIEREELFSQMDWRVFVALGIMMDALQSR